MCVFCIACILAFAGLVLVVALVDSGRSAPSLEVVRIARNTGAEKDLAGAFVTTAKPFSENSDGTASVTYFVCALAGQVLVDNGRLRRCHGSGGEHRD